MLYAVKGNKEKTIDESMIESCVQQGYKIVNADGVVVRDTTPTDLPSLKLAYNKHEDTIKALRKENESLKATISALESEIQELKAKATKPVTSSKGKGSKVASEE